MTNENIMRFMLISDPYEEALETKIYNTAEEARAAMKAAFDEICEDYGPEDEEDIFSGNMRELDEWDAIICIETYGDGDYIWIWKIVPLMIEGNDIKQVDTKIL